MENENKSQEVMPENDLQKVVEESKKELSELAQVPVKKRGRPSKQSTTLNTQNQGVNTPAPVQLPYVPSPMRPALEASFDMISSYANISTSSEKFTLSKEEKEILGMQADMLAMDLMPQGASSTTQKAIALGLTSTMIYGSKYLDYIQDKLKDAENQTPNPNNEIRAN